MTKKLSVFVVATASVALVLSGCGRGPGMDGMEMPDDMPMAPAYIGTWHFAVPVATEVTFDGGAFTVTVGRGRTVPIGLEMPFAVITTVEVKGTIVAQDDGFMLTVGEDADSVVIGFINNVPEAVQTSALAGVKQLLAEAATEPVIIAVDEEADPATMTVTGSFISTLIGLSENAKLKGCKDMPCSAPYVMQWWNTLNRPQMVAALYGDMATPRQAAAAMMMYANLDPITKGRVDVAAAQINGHVSYDSVGEWWESLDCREMRIAVGDGNTHDPMSAYCAHYPGSGAEKILGEMEKDFVDKVGMALLGLDEPGTYPPEDEG